MKNALLNSVERLPVSSITEELDNGYITAVKQWTEERGYKPRLAVISGYDAKHRELTQRALMLRRPEIRYATEYIGCQADSYIVRRVAMRPLIAELNDNAAVSGIVLELPVPATATEDPDKAAKAGGKLIERISADKDIIGLHCLSKEGPIAQPDEYPGTQAAAIRRIIDGRGALGWHGGMRITFAGLDDSLTTAYLKESFRDDAFFYDVPEKIDPKDLDEQKERLRERLHETDILVTDRRLSRLLGRSMLRPDMLVVDMGTYTANRSPNKLLEPPATKEPQGFGNLNFPLAYVGPRDIANITLREVVGKMLSPEKPEE